MGIAFSESMERTHTMEDTMIIRVELDRSELTESSSLPHHAASKLVDLKACTCDYNGMCNTCQEWQVKVRYFRTNPQFITIR